MEDIDFIGIMEVVYTSDPKKLKQTLKVQNDSIKTQAIKSTKDNNKIVANAQKEQKTELKDTQKEVDNNTDSITNSFKKIGKGFKKVTSILKNTLKVVAVAGAVIYGSYRAIQSRVQEALGQVGKTQQFSNEILGIATLSGKTSNKDIGQEAIATQTLQSAGMDLTTVKDLFFKFQQQQQRGLISKDYGIGITGLLTYLNTYQKSKDKSLFAGQVDEDFLKKISTLQNVDLQTRINEIQQGSNEKSTELGKKLVDNQVLNLEKQRQLSIENANMLNKSLESINKNTINAIVQQEKIRNKNIIGNLENLNVNLKNLNQLQVGIDKLNNTVFNSFTQLTEDLKNPDTFRDVVGKSSPIFQLLTNWFMDNKTKDRL